MAYNEDERIFREVVGDTKFNQVSGACYVTINATHFVQIGGQTNGDVLNEAYIFRLVSDFKVNQPQYKQKYHLDISRLPPLTVKRKYQGCTKGNINDKSAIIVAGGIGENDQGLKSVEYLTFLNSNQNDGSNNKELATLTPYSDSFHFGVRRMDNNTDKWNELPHMTVARSRFPTLIVSNNELLIVGGKCLPKVDESHCTVVERLNTTQCRWISIDEHLEGIRYDHNSGEIPLSSCNGETHHQIRRQGFENHNRAS